MEHATYTAEELNAHLLAGGAVLVATYTRATEYRQKHAGWFSTAKDGALLVQSGNRKDRLSLADGSLIVSIRLGYPKGSVK